MFSIGGVEISPALLLACISGIIWAARTEGRFNAHVQLNEAKMNNLKDQVDKIEIANQEIFKDMLKTLKDIQKSQSDMNIEVVKVMNEVKHMNTKITRLESGKVLPILSKYFDDEGNPTNGG